MSLTSPVNHRENARNVPPAQTNHLHLGSLLPAMAMGNAIKSEHARPATFGNPFPRSLPGAQRILQIIF